MKVTKRDGSQEDFDRTKVVGGALKAGATQEEAEKIAGEVETWVGTVEGGVVSSNDIAAKVVEALRSTNSAAANAYEAFRTSKDK